MRARRVIGITWSTYKITNQIEGHGNLYTFFRSTPWRKNWCLYILAWDCVNPRLIGVFSNTHIHSYEISFTTSKKGKKTAFINLPIQMRLLVLLAPRAWSGLFWMVSICLTDEQMEKKKRHIKLSLKLQSHHPANMPQRGVRCRCTRLRCPRLDCPPAC